VGGICHGIPQQVVAAGKKDSLDLGQTDKKAQMQAALRITLLNSKYISHSEGKEPTRCDKVCSMELP
jgi:hypothetical protein